MLVLTRTKDQTIDINGCGPVKITIVEITQSRVRLGFDAPSGTTILRDDAVDRGQGTLWDIDGFRDECQGVCGV